jgi:hypothetical protein
MKHILNKTFYGLVLIFIVMQVSCSKEIFTKSNENPNAPSTATPGNILPGVQTSLAYTQGGDIARYTCLLTQQSVGFSRQAAAYYSYVFTSTDFDTPWGNTFTSVLGNNKDLLQKADAAGYNVYGGIGRIITAYALQLFVDEWGDLPYSQAFQGDALQHPAYDNQQALYDTIENLLDVAIAKAKRS